MKKTKKEKEKIAQKWSKKKKEINSEKKYN